jgi:hypothetical protein
MNTSIQFLKDFCDFSNPNWVWILTGITRNKENTDKNSFMKRFIITKPEDIEKYYNILMEFMDKSKITYRIYISLNARDTVKTLFNFQKQLIDIGYEVCRGINNNNVNKIDSLWKTELAQMNNRGTKRFLLDIDNVEEELGERGGVVESLLVNHIPLYDILFIRRTPNGYAVVINPMDTRALLMDAKNKNIEIIVHKDSMVFVEQIIVE